MESSHKYKFLGKYENFEQLDKFTFHPTSIKRVSTKIECYMVITLVSTKKTDSLHRLCYAYIRILGTSNWLIADIQKILIGKAER